VYAPWLYGAARIHFADSKRKIDETRRVAFRVPLEPATKVVDWEAALPIDVRPEDLRDAAPAPASYLPLPPGAMNTTVFTRWARRFDRWLARTQRLEVAAQEDGQPSPIRPKRGGVSVDLVAIVWERR
jgi:hypothetical protein